MPPSAEAISALLGPLYEAAACPTRWPEFFETLQRHLLSDTALFLLIDPENRFSINISPGVEPEWQRAYAAHFHQHNVLFASYLAAKKAHGEWVGTAPTVIPNRDYFRTTFFNDFIKPQSLFHHLGAVWSLDGGIEGGLSIHRASDKGEFSSDSVALLSMLTPHLKQALNMHRALSRERSHQSALRQTVETLDLGLLSVDGRGRVLRTTPAARAILEKRDGIRLERGTLTAGVAGEQTRLRKLIAGAVATGSGRGVDAAVQHATRTAPEANSHTLWTPSSGGAMLLSRQPPKRPLQLMVTPFCSSELLLDEHPAALVFLSDPDAELASRASVLRALYRLTPTECRVADLIFQGCEVSATSDQMNTTVATTRSHLKAIFRKTGTSRQSELVRLVSKLPGVRLANGI